MGESDAPSAEEPAEKSDSEKSDPEPDVKPDPKPEPKNDPKTGKPAVAETKPDPKPGETPFWEVPHPRAELERLLKALGPTARRVR